MKPVCRIAIGLSLLLLHGASAAAGAAEDASRPSIRAPQAGPASREIEFGSDDAEAQRIARKLLAKEIAEEERYAAEVPKPRTAWVKISPSQPRALLVLHGCSPTGNCGLYGFERSDGGWRQILNSIAQTCALLPSSHHGRRDLVARMHGSATESAIKTYWWRESRYARVSVRNVTYAR